MAERKPRRNAVQKTPAMPTTARGLQTRQALVDAAIRVLNRVGYAEARIADITEETGVPISLFYRYFRSREDIVRECLDHMRAAAARSLAETPRGATPFERIFGTTRSVIRYYAENPGLLRCAISFGGEDGVFEQIFHDITMEQNQAITKSLARRFTDPGVTDDQRLRLSHSLGSMVDNFAYEYYVLKNAHLRATLPDSDSIARFLSILWYRALYGADPDKGALGGLGAMTALRLPTEA